MWFDAISIRVVGVRVGDATLLVGRGGGEQERVSLRESCFLLRWHRYRRNSEAKQTDNSRNAFSEARSFKRSDACGACASIVPQFRLRSLQAPQKHRQNLCGMLCCAIQLLGFRSGCFTVRFCLLQACEYRLCFCYV